MSDLPTPELQAFTMTVTEAVDLAGAGQADEGLRVLEGALARAEEIWEDERYPWAGELVARYRDAMRRFEERYGAGRVRN